MTKKMLQFIDLNQETPEKRSTTKRKSDFNEIYEEYINKNIVDFTPKWPSTGVIGMYFACLLYTSPSPRDS